MKAPTLLSIATLVTAVYATPSHAEPLRDKQGAVGAAKFTAGAVVGGLAGGPLGAVVGAIAGGMFADQKLKHDVTEAELATTRVTLEDLQKEVALHEKTIAALEEETLARMELQVFFDTGADQLSELDRQKLNAVADYLTSNASISVKLDGYADPRGTDEYNNVLSRERAASVKAALVERGVSENRVHMAGHGSGATPDGNALASYASERRVDITLEAAAERTAAHQRW